MPFVEEHRVRAKTVLRDNGHPSKRIFCEASQKRCESFKFRSLYIPVVAITIVPLCRLRLNTESLTIGVYSCFPVWHLVVHRALPNARFVCVEAIHDNPVPIQHHLFHNRLEVSGTLIVGKKEQIINLNPLLVDKPLGVGSSLVAVLIGIEN